MLLYHHVETQLEGCHFQPGRESSQESEPCCTLILNFQPPELWATKSLLSHPDSGILLCWIEETMKTPKTLSENCLQIISKLQIIHLLSPFLKYACIILCIFFWNFNYLLFYFILLYNIVLVRYSCHHYPKVFIECSAFSSAQDPLLTTREECYCLASWDITSKSETEMEINLWHLEQG